MATVIGTVKAVAKMVFDRKEQNNIINNHFLGQDNCNEVNDEGKIVPIDDKNIHHVISAQNNVTTNLQVEIKADLLDTGRLTNLRVAE